MEAISEICPPSRSLPEVVGEKSQTGPDSGPGRASGQHSTQSKLAFKHTDGSFYAAAKPLQLSKPSLSLVSFFCLAQATHFRNADFLNPRLAKLQHVVGTVVAAIRGEFLGFYAQSVFARRSSDSSSVRSLGLPL